MEKPRIRPTMQDHRDAQDFRFMEEHPDAVFYLGMGMWAVWKPHRTAPTPKRGREKDCPEAPDHYAQVEGLGPAVKLARKLEGG